MLRRHASIVITLSLLVLGCGAEPEESSATTVQDPAAVRVADPEAAAILEAALARYEERARGIENYTVRQSAMGIESTVYFEREMVDGTPRFRSRLVEAMGREIPSEFESGEDPYAALSALAGRTTLSGTETVDGHRTHVLVVEDFSSLPGLTPDAEGVRDADFDRATLYLDAENYVIRKMVMEGSMEREGERLPVTVTGVFEDYRDISGMLHPFRTVMTMDGMAPAASGADMEEARRGLAEMRSRLESMPPAQREMMERAIRPQMEQMESMMGGGGMEMVIEVLEIRVNTGPPTR
jgi:hypothetical protein